MGCNYFLLRISAVKRSFISKGNEAHRTKFQAGQGVERPPGRNDGKRKKEKYIRHDTLKVKVYAYQNPEPLNRVDITAPWYQEHKVVETGKYWVIAFAHGYRVKYTVQVYTFKGIPNNDRKLQELFNHLRKNPKGTYSGWLHHANIYWQVTRLHKEQRPLNYFL